MNKTRIERGLAALLFVMVLVVFSFAQRDSRKLDRLYAKNGLLTKSLSQPALSKPGALASAFSKR